MSMDNPNPFKPRFKGAIERAQEKIERAMFTQSGHKNGHQIAVVCSQVGKTKRNNKEGK